MLERKTAQIEVCGVEMRSPIRMRWSGEVQDGCAVARAVIELDDGQKRLGLSYSYF